MHYEAQVSVIRRQMGDLESVRLGLGLSQRKMSQLLMVDPSSWTRWTRQGDEAPPHIWRALQWYSVLQEKIPGLTPQYFINQSPQVLHQKALQELDGERITRQAEMQVLSQKIEGFSAERSEFENELAKLKKDLKFHKKLSIFILSLSIVWACVLLIGKFI
jgi:transcriptional regulator with XRE-family HTH domain